MGRLQSGLGGDGPDLLLGQPPQGEEGPGQLVLGEGRQHIALVLLGPEGLAQQPAARPGIVLRPGVVAGGQLGAAQLPRPVQQRAELHRPVTPYAGVGGAPPLIVGDKGLDHPGPEFLAHI